MLKSIASALPALCGCYLTTRTAACNQNLTDNGSASASHHILEITQTNHDNTD